MSDYNVMTQRQRDDLDRHITGNYGEDQLKAARTLRQMVLAALSDCQPATKQDLAGHLLLTPAQVGHALQRLKNQRLAICMPTYIGARRWFIWLKVRRPA